MLLNGFELVAVLTQRPLAQNQHGVFKLSGSKAWIEFRVRTYKVYILNHIELIKQG